MPFWFILWETGLYTNHTVRLTINKANKTIKLVNMCFFFLRGGFVCLFLFCFVLLLFCFVLFLFCFLFLLFVFPFLLPCTWDWWGEKHTETTTSPFLSQLLIHVYKIFMQTTEIHCLKAMGAYPTVMIHTHCSNCCSLTFNCIKCTVHARILSQAFFTTGTRLNYYIDFDIRKERLNDMDLVKV